MKEELFNGNVIDPSSLIVSNDQTNSLANHQLPQYICAPSVKWSGAKKQKQVVPPRLAAEVANEFLASSFDQPKKSRKLSSSRLKALTLN
jgi:hypothetical protein